MTGGLRIFRIAGIDVHLDWSLIIVFLLITGTLAGGLFPAWHPDWTPLQSWMTALAAGVLFFCSVLLHELAHALVGRRHGMLVRRITLFVFGGMAQLENEPRQWRGELWMAAAGPLTSVVIGLSCLWLGTALSGTTLPDDPDGIPPWLASLGTVPTLLVWLGQVNIVLALFNLVPGFPLDGGRVLRAVFWGATGNYLRATRWASNGGQIIAWLLIASGFAMILGAEVPIFGRGLVNGLWLALIGWFLNNAAVMSYRQALAQDALRDVTVSRLMQTDVHVVAPGISVAELVDDHLLRSPQPSFPVVEEDARGDQRLVGLVGLDDVRRLDRSRWPMTQVRDIMTPVAQLTTLAPGDLATDAIRAARGRGENQFPVLEHGHLRGLLRLQDIPRWLALQEPDEGRPGRHV